MGLNSDWGRNCLGGTAGPTNDAGNKGLQAGKEKGTLSSPFVCLARGGKKSVWDSALSYPLNLIRW